MNTIKSIYKREMKTYFVSPVAYVVLTIVFIIAGIFFYGYIKGARDANITNVLSNLAFVFLFLSPFVTMRLIAEEKAAGTLELLLTSPVTPFQIVMGKFLAAFSIMLLAIAGTLLYVVILLFHSSMEIGPLISGYLGLCFLSAAYIGIGLIASTFSESQIVAGIVGFGASLVLMLLYSFGGEVMKQISPIAHYLEFANGIIEVKHLIYFLLWAVFCLSVSTKAVESRLLK